MSDFGDIGDCGDGDCDCGDCDCGSCDCDFDCCDCDCDCCDCDCDCCDDCCDCSKCECENWFKCGCCGGDDRCCRSDPVDDDDSVDVRCGHRNSKGCGWSFCFSVTDDDCCDIKGRRRRRNQRRYELERRRQMETQGPSVIVTIIDAPTNQVPTTDSVLPASSDQEPNIDNVEKPTAITTQPPSYEEATQKEHVVTSQPT
ncbi:uncharacterized protein LOC125654916 [Ostrea edulis]|uniref:uncharacterized protein LOC125654916 n=1 Tax=Ostrea edulis TaxID=37623 RepID=UPI00209602B9|nr:uncharacterized protein LOC125654916 [Ostrea edulis]